MKTKLYKILGVALTMVLLASLTVGLAGAAGAAETSKLKFSKLELPRTNADGDYWTLSGSDVGPIAQTPDGDILFAAVLWGTWNVLKSTDGGYSWVETSYYNDVVDIGGYNDTTAIVDVVTSPEYGDDTTLIVASQDYVYISEDGGKNFTQLADPGWGTINDLDVTIAEDGDLTLMVATDDPEVFVTSGLLAWTAQDIATSFADAYDVLACAFLPTFADDGDIGITAIVVNFDGAVPYWTTLTFSFADISAGGEWGDDIMDATFVNANMDPFDAQWASIAFPDDFDAFGVGNNVCFVGVVEEGDLGETSVFEDSGSDAYRVILKEAGSSTAIDLDVRGILTTLAPTGTAVTSIDVCGNAEDATILVGTDAINLGDAPEYFSAYLSEDSGDNFTPSDKCPTGGDGAGVEFSDVFTRVMMAPDFCESGMAYASTMGSFTSAFQRTTDANVSWNQISIVDYDTDYWVTDYGFNAFGYIAEDQLWMITSTDTMYNPALPTWVQAQNCALWARLDGMHWERILSYATPGVSDQLFQLQILGDGSAMFAADLTAGEIWRSTDLGVTWPKKINTKPNPTWIAPVSPTTIYTSHANGEIWWSERSGTGWQSPDDSEIPAGAVIITMTVMGDIVTCGTLDGQVFISSDGGETVERVGASGPFNAFEPALEGADLGFAENGILYAVSPGLPDVMRAEVDLDDPGDASWEQIDDNQGDPVEYDETHFMAGGPPICLPFNDIVYIADLNASGGDFGGIWRSTNPTADTDSTHPPYFERENKGLDANSMLGLLGLDLEPPTLAPTFFFVNYNPANYWDQVVFFTDTLNVGVPLAMPEADETGVGLLPEGYVYPEVTIAWQEMAGATSYQYQIAIDPEFKTPIPPGCGFTSSLAVGGIQLDPNMTYYWRVRVADEGSLIGAPLISPWSETWKFKTAIGASMARPDLQAPWPGEPDVPLSPTFEWSGIEWAETYEYELALDPATTAGGYFAEPLVALVGTNALVSTAWKCDITLDYETRYYWHVKAIGVDTDTPWSDVGTFTTMGVPPEPVDPGGDIVIPPAQQITPAWIWAIVIIGAILVIAVIVLIVTTRRVP